MNQTKKSYIFALSAVLLWSTVATAFKIALAEMQFLQLLLFSSFFSTITLFVILFYFGKNKLSFSNKIDLKYSFFLGLLNPFLYYIVLFKAYSLIPAQEALTLNYTWAIMLVLFSAFFLKQKLTVKSFFSILISFLGVVVIATRGDIFGMKFHEPFGAFLAAGSSIIWAGYWILNMKDKREVIVKLSWNFLFGFILILLTEIVLGDISMPTIKGLLASAYIGLFEMGITFVFWLKAMEYAKSTASVGNFIYLSPFLSLIWINIILNEEILISTIVGFILIIAGILLQRRTA